jgi:hypothetical protein
MVGKGEGGTEKRNYRIDIEKLGRREKVEYNKINTSNKYVGLMMWYKSFMNALITPRFPTHKRRTTLIIISVWQMNSAHNTWTPQC